MKLIPATVRYCPDLWVWERGRGHGKLCVFVVAVVVPVVFEVCVGEGGRGGGAQTRCEGLVE